MPELPDVQVFKRHVDATSLHKRIETVRLSAPAILVGASERTLRERLRGARLVRTHRHASASSVRISSPSTSPRFASGSPRGAARSMRRS